MPTAVLDGGGVLDLRELKCIHNHMVHRDKHYKVKRIQTTPAPPAMILTLHSAEAQFNSGSGHRLSSLKLFVVSLKIHQNRSSPVYNGAWGSVVIKALRY